ncbi:MAG: AAA family ATPase [Methanosarcinaceae archaeon]|nr:AAA family ATPase [Methanosarcinaceae archaeon]MDD4497253.1 AAA family ATPase [Methanosarcinaceae archaeon]
MHDIWTVKYRPKILEEVLGNTPTLKTLSDLVRSGTLPHLVLHGPENSGKTTTALALAFELYGESWKSNFTYFNASDFFDQGKRYLVRDRRFVRIIGTDDPKKIYKSVIEIFKEIINEYSGMAPLDADYRLIYIDNAESLSPDGQHALRRIMERYSKTCRFILSTTRPSKLISPLRSRGVQLFFTYVSDKALKAHLIKIAEEEKLELTDGALDAVLYAAKGNVAEAIRTLQLTSLEAGEDRNVTEDLVYEVTVMGRDGGMDELFMASVAGNFQKARKLIDEMLIDKGLSGIEILEGLCEAALNSGDPDEDTALMVTKIADTDFYLLDAANERIQLERLVTELS